MEKILNNRYRLVELLGAGGMAVVCKGWDTLLDRPVAIKLLRESFVDDPAFLARFQREARSAARLIHPNVVTVYDVGQDGHQHYIVMEHVAGQDLKTLIRQEGGLSVRLALDLAIQMCAGVGAAHHAGIVHCDLKPQNVLVTSDGRVKVADFGIARALSEYGLTESETVWGSPLYFSPEQASGEAPSPASDVYSLGVILFEMLSGHPPFAAENPTALALMHLQEPVPSLNADNSQVPPQVEWVVQKVLAKEPTARYRTAEQFGRVLEELVRQHDQATGVQPAGPVYSLAPGATPVGVSAVQLLQGPALAVPAPVRVRPARRTPPAWLDWLVVLLAVVSVLGLVPLGSMVYDAYFQSAPVDPTRTPPPVETPTTGVAGVMVPLLVGLPLDTARTATAGAGLVLHVQEQRADASRSGWVVLEQEPAPGQYAQPGAAIAVVLAGSDARVPLENWVGRSAGQARLVLSAADLDVVLLSVWSAEEEGTVLEQEPAGGTELTAGETVTLTVSGGLNVPISLDVNLGDQIVLDSAEVRQARVQRGETLLVTLNWRALQDLAQDYTVFVHVHGPLGMAGQDDSQPAQGMRPSSTWTRGIVIPDQHPVSIGREATPGTYELRVGLYPSGNPADRLPIVDPGQTTAESNSIFVALIEVLP